MKKVVIAGVSGEGKTVKDAHADASSKIAVMLDGEWSPAFLTHQEHQAIVVRQPSPRNQWGYRLLIAGETQANLWIDPNYETRQSALKAAARHLAQAAGSYAGLEHLLDLSEQAELDRYFSWQTAYSQARASGLDDDAARRVASQH